MTYVLGLTGSIGMGKSTTAQMFRDLGVPVWDADAAVHRLYAPGGAGAAAVRTLCPGAITESGGVDRDLLRQAIAREPDLLTQVSAAVHPLVAQDRQAFLRGTSAPLVVLDIPLLFEGGGADLCDGVAVVSAPAAVQRKRVLARGLTQAEFDLILSRQMPDDQKRACADFIIPSDTMSGARRRVRAIVAELTGATHA